MDRKCAHSAIFWTIVAILSLVVSTIAARQILVIERQKALIEHNIQQDEVSARLSKDVIELSIELRSHMKAIEQSHPRVKVK